jgi:hypothetical protein
MGSLANSAPNLLALRLEQVSVQCRPGNFDSSPDSPQTIRLVFTMTQLADPDEVSSPEESAHRAYFILISSGSS